MQEDARSPAEFAADINAARERLIGFVRDCSDEQWHSAPLDGDPRPVGVVVDHVAHAYEYLAGWIRETVAGQPADVNGDVVDELNAQHAQAAASVNRADATAHLLHSGDAISALVAGLSAADLEAGGGRVRRFAQIAVRHADDHRSEIETALAGQAGGPAGGTPGRFDDLAAALHAPGPDPARAEHLHLFGRFVGAWDIEWHGTDSHGQPATMAGELHFGWVLGGRAVQDVWKVPASGQPPATLRPFCGTTLRFYDPAIAAWRSTWIDPLNGRVRRFIGRPEGDDIVLDGLDDDPPERWGFRDISENFFRWTGEVSDDHRRTWRLDEQMLIRRRS